MYINCSGKQLYNDLKQTGENENALVRANGLVFDFVDLMTSVWKESSAVLLNKNTTVDDHITR